MIPLPPVARSRVALGLTAAAALGKFELQTCRDCGAVQYPPREACSRCLSVRLAWQSQADSGQLLARTVLRHSNEPYFRQRLPWAIGLVKLDCGPNVLAHLHEAVTSIDMRVRVALRLDRAGAAVIVALPNEEVSNLPDLSCDPKARNVLVTDATSEVGIALVHALRAAGAHIVPADLDITDDASVAAAGAQVGSDIDILINNAERRPDAEAQGFENGRRDMELYYFGLMRLAREFGPRMRERNAKGDLKSVAWVNLLSIQALGGSAANESFAAAQAAALSFSKSLRAQMLPAGIRVMNVFAGPIEQGAAGLADEIVSALKLGLEDVYPGDHAKHVYARWRENPKGLEREL